MDTTGLVVDPGERTGLTVVLARSRDRAILTFPGAIASLRAEAVDGDLLSAARHVPRLVVLPPDRARARAPRAHLLLTTSGVARVWTREPPAVEFPVTVARRRCLLDHLIQLQNALAEHAGPCVVDVDDHALEHIDLA